MTCTIINNDKPPVGKRSTSEPEGGTVRVQAARQEATTCSKRAAAAPRHDHRHAQGPHRPDRGREQEGPAKNADFYDGIFKLGQTKGKKPITVLTLVEKLTGCKATGKKASTAKKKKKVKRRRLWGNGKGRFRTKGKHSAATVVGTKWYVEDRCTSTLTKVARGKVKVRDFVKHKTVLVKKGHRYIARAK